MSARAPELVEVVLLCQCGSSQVERLDGDAPAKKAIAAVTCLFCTRTGAMRMWRADRCARST